MTNNQFERLTTPVQRSFAALANIELELLIFTCSQYNFWSTSFPKSKNSSNRWSIEGNLPYDILYVCARFESPLYCFFIIGKKSSFIYIFSSSCIKTSLVMSPSILHKIKIMKNCLAHSLSLSHSSPFMHHHTHSVRKCVHE